MNLYLGLRKDDTSDVALQISVEWGDLSQIEAVNLMDSILSSRLGLEPQWASLVVDGETEVTWLLSRDEWGNREFTRTEAVK